MAVQQIRDRWRRKGRRGYKRNKPDKKGKSFAVIMELKRKKKSLDAAKNKC